MNPMNLPQQAFVNVSGTDTNDGATKVFVWSHDKSLENPAFLGSGHVVGLTGRPPGIKVGQFSVTFLLPPECSVDDIFVTDDAGSKERLAGVIVTPCQADSGSRFEQIGSASDDAAQVPGSAMSSAAHNTLNWS